MTEMNPQGEGDVSSQAAMWFAKLRTLPLSTETLDEFSKWKQEPAHAAAFEAVERFWSKAGAAAYAPEVVAATQAALRRQPRHVLAWKPSVALPAALALMLAIGGVSYIALGRGGETYATEVGKQSAVRLSDGSRVRLDTDTKLTVDFSGDMRRVALVKGQASFAVAHDPAHPFTVDAGGDRVTAIGTRFDVRRDGDITRVTLVEGRIRIDPRKGAPQVLTAGQQWNSDSGAPQHPVRPADLTSATAWEGGRIVLDGRSLADAVAEVGRYSPHSVRLDAPLYAQARLSGSVVAGDTSSFVAAATAMLPLRAIVNANGSITLAEQGHSF